MTPVDGGWSGLPVTVLLLSAAAWLIAFAAHVGGWGQRLSHDRMIDEGAGLLQTVVVFLGGWQMMVAAMMLPASLAASRRFETLARRNRRRMVLRLAFLGGYLARLTVFGIAALIGDILIHGLVDAWPWLGARPWLIGGTVLTLAGGFELALLSTRLGTNIEATIGISAVKLDSVGATRMGADHGLQELRRCWPLMLLSFAVGMTNLAWMAALTLVMILDGPRSPGRRVAAAIAGAVLLSMGVLVLAQPGWLPAFLPVGADPVVVDFDHPRGGQAIL
jgi:predicted metal-binding membrane protein